MAKYPLFAARDVDGFFGLFVDNLVQLLLIVSLCGACGIGPSSPLLLGAILPGAAISILLGNVFYAVQAHMLARKEGRDDVTALPYGINTPSLLVYIYLVMLPAYSQATAAGVGEEAAARAAWLAGVLACFGSGLIEFFGAFVAGWVRRRTPRAALLSTLAGIAIGFIAMTFALQIFQRPLVAMLPLAIILLTYFANVRFPLGVPGGLLAILIGTACAWIFPAFVPESISGPKMDVASVKAAWQLKGLYLPHFVGQELWELAKVPSNWLSYLAVIIPMGIFNVVGSLQNIESAEAAGDRFATAPSLAVNGLGTLVGALFGSCFPTTIYIGHPGWKSMGARAGYSSLNGLVITLICLTGTVTLISTVIPVEAGVAIVLWIGIIITAQAFQATPAEHAPAVAIGFFPAIAAWGATLVRGAFEQAGGRSIQQLLELPSISGAPGYQGLFAEVNGFLIHGMLLLDRGFIFTCMILSAICVFLIERQFWSAAVWSLIASVLTFAGLMHGYQIAGNNIDFLFLGVASAEGASAYPAYGIGIGYLCLGAAFWAAEAWVERQAESAPVPRPKQKKRKQRREAVAEDA